jgi:hypothetical protein
MPCPPQSRAELPEGNQVQLGHLIGGLVLELVPLAGIWVPHRHDNDSAGPRAIRRRSSQA